VYDIKLSIFYLADPAGRAAQGVVPPQLACWDCGFDSRREQGCLSLVIAVCCHVQICATDRSLVWRSTIECVSCLNEIWEFQQRGLGQLRLLCQEKEIILCV
jgi:hypothetical protein